MKTSIQTMARELLEGLYGNEDIEALARIAGFWAERTAPGTAVPESLFGVTNARGMAQPRMRAPRGAYADRPMLRHLGIVNGGWIFGPLASILARPLMVPMMLQGYLDNYPDDAADRAIYTDPPMLMLPPDQLKRVCNELFKDAMYLLGDEQQEFLTNRLLALGAVCQEATEMEPVFAGASSTAAYCAFGVHHLMPGNAEVCITSTSTGLVIPSEADPLKYKVPAGQTRKHGNPFRFPYFRMLNLSVKRPDHVRRYFADRNGAKKGLKSCSGMADTAKAILRVYLGLGDRFQIRIGEVRPEMTQVTFVSSMGGVLSVRDDEDKKIAHNVTVISAEAKARWQKVFDEQWAAGMPLTEAVVDELLAEQ